VPDIREEAGSHGFIEVLAGKFWADKAQHLPEL